LQHVIDGDPLDLAFGFQDHAMPQNRLSHGFDVVGSDVFSSTDGSQGLAA
jgi:hypothetical protein